MQDEKEKARPTSVKSKILSGFLLAFVAILLAMGITQYAFQDMLDTVEALSAPSEKLGQLNRVFQEITKLDQLQRAEAIRSPKKPYNVFLDQSQVTFLMVDSLMLLDWDTMQRARIGSMKRILHDRDSLFFSYLKLKSNLIDNKSLTSRIDTLSNIIEQKKIEVDTSVVTTQKKTTTTFVHDTVAAKDDRGFIGKIFGKKKKVESEPEVKVKVQEELSVSVDTLAVSKQNKALDEVAKIVQDLETDQRLQNKKLLNRELELINTNSLLISQLLNILHDVERRELASMRKRSAEASLVVNESIQRISLLLLVFFLGAALLVYLIWSDISQSNFYKEQLEKSRDEAEELSLIKQRFLANMSHEIRTPLQSIIGFAEQLRQKPYADREAVDAIHSSSEHLLHIVNEVLDYSRISSGNLTFAQDDFRLLSVVREVESAIRIQAEKKKIDFVVDTHNVFDAPLIGDSFRLRQILYNVLGNAVKFTTKGFVTLEVYAWEESAHIRCQFKVIDTGIGIHQDDIQKIFKQFEQANATIERNFGGTGLGLTIVKSLIEAQGGNLQVTSEPGHGSTFTISLAFAKGSTTVAAPTVPEFDSTSTFDGKVLVVDDDPMILRLCGLILEKHNIYHRLYIDSEEMLHAKPDPEVTHILMDIRMPKVGGVELCKALRKKYSPDVRFVALTAHVFEQDKKALRESGFDIVLSKPFHEEDLIKMFGLSPASHQAVTVPVEPYTLDLGPLRRLTMNDERLLHSVLLQFLDETQTDLGTLNSGLGNRDVSVIREVIHKIAGRVGQMGIGQLAMKLRQIENRIHQGEEFDGIETPVIHTRREIDEIVAAVQALVTENVHSS
jgi:signal transduction histidine kinase/FixJ family two-component response regulator